jgi:hypothetical protein
MYETHVCCMQSIRYGSFCSATVCVENILQYCYRLPYRSQRLRSAEQATQKHVQLCCAERHLLLSSKYNVEFVGKRVYAAWFVDCTTNMQERERMVTWFECVTSELHESILHVGALAL